MLQQPGKKCVTFETGCYALRQPLPKMATVRKQAAERATFQNFNDVSSPSPPGWGGSPRTTRPAADRTGGEQHVPCAENVNQAPALLRARVAGRAARAEEAYQKQLKSEAAARAQEAKSDMAASAEAARAQRELGSSTQAQLKWLAQESKEQSSEALPTEYRAPCDTSWQPVGSEREPSVVPKREGSTMSRGSVRGGGQKAHDSPSVMTRGRNQAESPPFTGLDVTRLILDETDWRDGTRQPMWDPAWTKASPQAQHESKVKSRTPVDLEIAVVHQRLEAATGTQQRQQ